MLLRTRALGVAHRSTASGGTLGFLVHQSTTNAAVNLRYPPPLSPNITYDDLTFRTGEGGSVWWANAVNYLPHTREAAGALAKARRQGAPPDDSRGWWQDLMHTLFVLGCVALCPRRCCPRSLIPLLPTCCPAVHRHHPPPPPHRLFPCGCRRVGLLVHGCHAAVLHVPLWHAA